MNATGPRAICRLGQLTGGLAMIAVWAFTGWGLSEPSTVHPGRAYFVGSVGMLLAGAGASLVWQSLVALWHTRES